MIKIGDIMKRIILHIDVNNAFLSWTAILLLKKGYPYDIRKQYAVIGGDETKRKGVVLAKSTPAKKRGVVTGEPLYMARRKCPNLKVYAGNYKWYQWISNKMFALLSEYTPDIERFSIDECFIDYTPVQNLYGDVSLFCLRLKNRLYKELGFTVNIGIANNKLCAKMASDFMKPNRVHTLYDGEVEEKMYPLPIEELFGIGKKTSEKLKKLNIYTIGDLAHANSKLLYRYFKNQAVVMIQLAKGIDDSEVISKAVESKGISNSVTMDHNLLYKQDVYPIVDGIIENLCIQLRKQNRYTTVIAVLLKDKYFHTFSHQRKLMNASNTTHQLILVGRQLVDEMWNDEAIRLVGVRFDHLTDRLVHQVSLFENLDEKDKNHTLEKTVDELKEKYGNHIISNVNQFSIKRKYD